MGRRPGVHSRRGRSRFVAVYIQLACAGDGGEESVGSAFAFSLGLVRAEDGEAIFVVITQLVETHSHSSWPTSFLSIVPRLCLLEKGYTDDDYEIEHVDISEFLGGVVVGKGTDHQASGDNFSPNYLR